MPSCRWIPPRQDDCGSRQTWLRPRSHDPGRGTDHPGPARASTDKQQLAAEKHARFRDENSDFTGFLNLWNYLQEKQEELSSTQFRRLCRTEFINYLRVREWQDLFAQLRQMARPLGISLDNKRLADPVGNHEGIHMSLLSGLLSHIGILDERKREYAGARGSRFAIFPGSSLFKKSPHL
ncbi:ATP-dependent RNA helicase HrpA [Arthrobacter sp. Hiyo4]|nr:ATP-dependent RNA helicase HrpA [Arthrobacter sp. Hiyo4]